MQRVSVIGPCAVAWPRLNSVRSCSESLICSTEGHCTRLSSTRKERPRPVSATRGNSLVQVDHRVEFPPESRWKKTEFTQKNLFLKSAALRSSMLATNVERFCSSCSLGVPTLSAALCLRRERQVQELFLVPTGAVIARQMLASIAGVQLSRAEAMCPPLGSPADRSALRQ